MCVRGCEELGGAPFFFLKAVHSSGGTEANKGSDTTQ